MTKQTQDNKENVLCKTKLMDRYKELDKERAEQDKKYKELKEEYQSIQNVYGFNLMNNKKSDKYNEFVGAMHVQCNAFLKHHEERLNEAYEILKELEEKSTEAFQEASVKLQFSISDSDSEEFKKGILQKVQIDTFADFEEKDTLTLEFLSCADVKQYKENEVITFREKKYHITGTSYIETVDGFTEGKIVASKL